MSYVTKGAVKLQVKGLDVLVGSATQESGSGRVTGYPEVMTQKKHRQRARSPLLGSWRSAD